MANLVEDADIWAYLDLDPTGVDDPNKVVLALRDMAEDLLAQNTNRVYGEGEYIEKEQYDGTGAHLIFTRRNIDTLIKVEFRYLPEIVQELYFNLDILQYVTWTQGKRRIHSRVYPFPRGYDNVLITYNSSDDIPPLGQAAVRDLVAACYHRMGSEDARSEQKGTFQHSLIRTADESIIWKQACDSLTIPSIG